MLMAKWNPQHIHTPWIILYMRITNTLSVCKFLQI